MNIEIFRFLNSFSLQNIFLDKVIIFLASTFGVILIIFSVLFLFFYKYPKWDKENALILAKRRVKEILFIFGSAVLAWVAVEILKSLFAIPRPFLALKDVHLLFAHGGNDSFPSGHAAFFSSLATSIYFYHKKIGVWFFFGAVIIGVSRVMAGVHFPVDILGGFILGVGLTLILKKIWRYFRRETA